MQPAYPIDLPDSLEELAALRSVGLLTEAEMNTYEGAFLKKPEFRRLAAELNDVAASLAVAELGGLSQPPGDLRGRLLDEIGMEASPSNPLEALALDETEAVVVTNLKGRIEWASAAFTAMCGYSLAELRGRNPGALLQGDGTDPHTVARIREAVRAHQSITVDLRNYAKDRSPYWVSLAISPVHGPNGDLRGYVAFEKELTPEQASERGLV